MVIAMTKQITKNVITMEETVVVLASTMIIAKAVIALMRSFGESKVQMPFWVMALATKNITVLNVIMTKEIVLMYCKLVPLDFFLIQLEMATVMMKQTMKHVVMMGETVVEM